MDKTLLFKTKDAERPYDYWILICVNCASEVSAPWWRGATRHRADIPGQRECHDIPVWEFQTASAEIARLNAFIGSTSGERLRVSTKPGQSHSGDGGLPGKKIALDLQLTDLAVQIVDLRRSR